MIMQIKNFYNFTLFFEITVLFISLSCETYTINICFLYCNFSMNLISKFWNFLFFFVYY